MNLKNNEVLIGSEKAAHYATNISGWVDRHGHFFGENKDAAMYSRGTHRLCIVCNSPVKKWYTKCDKCRKKSEIDFYNKREVKVWDLETPVYSEQADRFFFSSDELESFFDEVGDCTFESLRLILCNPQYLTPIEIDYWGNVLPEDVYTLGQISKSLQELVENFNSALQEEDPVSWVPSKYAVVLPEGIVMGGSCG